MPIKSQNPAGATGLGAMSLVLEGYMQGEEIKRKRHVEERAYGHEREVFAENTRRFDLTFEEGIRQFDTNLSFQAEQSALMRQHQFDLQDDAQEFSHEETELERISREEHQDKQRGLEYHRIKKNVDMQNEDRALRAEANENARLRRYLGNAETFDDVDDENVVGLNNQLYSPGEIDIPTELGNIVQGKGSNVLNLSPEQAAQDLDTLEKNPEQLRNLGIDYRETGALKFVVNTRKEDGLRALAIKRAGGLEAWTKLSPERKEQLDNELIHDLNNLGPAEKKQQREELDFYARKAEIELGTSPYRSGGNSASVYGDLAAANGLPFVWDSELGIPVATSLATPAIAEEAVQMGMWTSRYMTLANDPRYLDDEEGLLEAQNEAMLNIKQGRDRMAAHMKENDIDPSYASKYYDSMVGMTNGTIDTSAWAMDRNHPIRRDAGPMGTSRDLDGGIQTSAGTIFPGQKGYEEAVKIEKDRVRTQKADEFNRIAADTRRREESIQKELETEELKMNAATNIEKFNKTQPPSDVMKEFERIMETTPGLDYDSAASTAYHNVGKSGHTFILPGFKYKSNE